MLEEVQMTYMLFILSNYPYYYLQNKLRNSQACVLSFHGEVLVVEGLEGELLSDGADAIGLQDRPATDPSAMVVVPLR